MADGTRARSGAYYPARSPISQAMGRARFFYVIQISRRRRRGAHQKLSRSAESVEYDGSHDAQELAALSAYSRSAGNTLRLQPAGRTPGSPDHAQGIAE